MKKKSPVSICSMKPSKSRIVHGIDVSSYQGDIDFDKVYKAGKEYVIIRATEGTDFVDEYLYENYEKAKKSGFKIGFYHYLTAYTIEESRLQAEFFVKTTADMKPDIKYVLDFELTEGMTKKQYNDIAIAFLKKVEELTNKKTILYSSQSKAKDLCNKKLAKEFPLWVAEYEVGIPNDTMWKYWEGWQYAIGTVEGITGSVDLDLFTTDILLEEKKKEKKKKEKQQGKKEEKVQEKKEYTEYVVGEGDTLNSIAKRYHTTVKELVRINKIKNLNKIYVGEKLLVPMKKD